MVGWHDFRRPVSIGLEVEMLGQADKMGVATTASFRWRNAGMALYRGKAAPLHHAGPVLALNRI